MPAEATFDTAGTASPRPVGLRLRFRGVVQGVGFRPWVYRQARLEGLGGSVRNDSAGVTVEAFGTPEALARFRARLQREAPPAARILGVEAEPIPFEPRAAAGFVIEASAAGSERRVSIPCDLATCDECLRELLDPADRRHGYPFINCTHCGPRFTIVQDVPYDRPATTMAAFAMCDACRREYDDPLDRRFHAQPNACPRCGPRLTVEGAEGPLVVDDALALAVARLCAGGIVAVKGLGGFHLACDAGSSAAVAELRRRKRRDEKPFAVMVRDLDAARAVAALAPADVELLTSVARPIVLVPRRAGAPLAAEVAPASPLVGLMLPYAPLHHLLLRAVDRPLVMTSANLSDEPLVYRDAEARRELAPLADLLLLHDREIATRCDDSVARVIAGSPTLLRRGRGHVPGPLPAPRPLARPVLACGAHLKNAPCLAAGDTLQLGPHVGDLETEKACDGFDAAVLRLERFLQIRPEVIAHDLHPGYYSTRYALGRPEPVKVGVQHHHAHVASAMAEHGLVGPVLGVAYDGTGWGPDGTAWGGELLLADYAGFERLGSFRPLALVGGDLAVREVWRLALALVEDAFEGAAPLGALRLFQGLPERRVAAVRSVLRADVNAPLARGVGRYFDAFGALGLERPSAAFEGQVALTWNLAAEAAAAVPAYPFSMAQAGAAEPWEVDLRPATRAAVADLLRGREAGAIARAFHETLVAATSELVARAVAARGPLPVLLTGGCFQNALLATGLQAGLRGRGLDVRLHREVPPGDGGIAVGQALVADAVARRGL